MLHNICVRYRGSEQLDILRTASFRSSLNGAARALSLLERELDSSLLEAGVFTQAVQSLSTIKNVQPQVLSCAKRRTRLQELASLTHAQ